MSEEIELPKVHIAWPDLESAKVSVTFTQTVGKWRSFIQSMEKSGSIIGKAIADVARPAIEEIERANKLMKESRK